MTNLNAWKNGQWNPFPDTCTTLPEPDDHIAWLIQRRGGIGSSDCAAVLGLDKYTSQYSLWLDKSGQIPLSQIDSEPAEWGRLLEPVIREKAAERLGFEARLCAGLASSERPWQRCSLDGVLITDEGLALLEIKNTSQYLREEWADGQVPDRAELQVMHSMAVTGADVAYVAGLIGGNHLVVRRVERDQELIDYLIQEEDVFMQHVVDGTAPPVTSRESLTDILAASGSPDVDELVLSAAQATDVRRWIDAYQQAGVDEKAAVAAKHEARNNLLVIADGHTVLVEQSGDVLHTLAKIQRGVFSKRRFRDEEPDLAPLFEKKVVDVDTAAIRAEDPALFARFQSRSIRLPKGA